MKGLIGSLVVAAIVVGGVVAVNKAYYVSPGNVGVLILKSGQNSKGVSDKPIQPGWGFRKLFVEDVQEYPIFLQTAIWTKNTKEGNVDDESITANSKEGLPVNLDVSLSYTLEAAKVPDLYVKFRSEIEAIQNTYIRQSTRQALQDVFGSYGVEDIYGQKKQEIVSKVQGALVEKLKSDGFNIQQFTINEVRLPGGVVEAINQKIQAQQSSLKAEQDLNRIKIERDQRIAQAEGEARAIQIQAEAVRAQGGAEYVMLQALLKWDGHGCTTNCFGPGTQMPVPFFTLK